jgi:hypothetical protein
MKKSLFTSLILGASLLVQPSITGFAEETSAVEDSFVSPKALTFEEKGDKEVATVEKILREDEDDDFYRITLSESKKINISIDSNEQVLIFSLMDQEKNKLLRMHNDVTHEKLSDEIALPKGDYIIQISRIYGNDIPYKMNIELSEPKYYELEPNGEFDLANPILLNTRYQANHHQLNTIMDTFIEKDYFKFEVPVTGRYGIKVKGDTAVYLYDQAQNFIKEIEWWDNTVTLAPGVYYLETYTGATGYRNQPYSFEIDALPFKDVTTDYWAVKEIAFLSEQGIIKGYKDGTFKPDSIVTRGQAAAMIVRALGLNTANRPAPSFKDIKNHWANKEIATLVAEGIYPNGGATFNPNQPLTREEMARIIVNGFKLKGGQAKDFKDVPKSRWSYRYIQALAANKITTGYIDGTFKPTNPVTRAQFSVFLSRVLDERYIQ